MRGLILCKIIELACSQHDYGPSYTSLLQICDFIMRFLTFTNISLPTDPLLLTFLLVRSNWYGLFIADVTKCLALSSLMSSNTCCVTHIA